MKEWYLVFHKTIHLIWMLVKLYILLLHKIIYTKFPYNVPPYLLLNYGLNQI